MYQHITEVQFLVSCMHTASFTVAACFVGSRVLKRDWQKRWTEFRRFESMLHVSFIDSAWSMSHCVVGSQNPGPSAGLLFQLYNI